MSCCRMVVVHAKASIFDRLRRKPKTSRRTMPDCSRTARRTYQSVATWPTGKAGSLHVHSRENAGALRQLRMMSLERLCRAGATSVVRSQPTRCVSVTAKLPETAI